MAYDQPKPVDVPPPEPAPTPMEKWEAYEDKLNIETRTLLIEHRAILQEKGDLAGVEATNDMIAKVEALIPEDVLAEVREPTPAEKFDTQMDQMNSETRDILVQHREILQDKNESAGVEATNEMIANVERLLPNEPASADQTPVAPVDPAVVDHAAAAEQDQAAAADRQAIDSRIEDLEYQLELATEAGDEQLVAALSLEIAALRQDQQ